MAYRGCWDRKHLEMSSLGRATIPASLTYTVIQVSRRIKLPQYSSGTKNVNSSPVKLYSALETLSYQSTSSHPSVNCHSTRLPSSLILTSFLIYSISHSIANLAEHYLALGIALNSKSYNKFCRSHLNTIIKKLYVPPLLSQISPNFSAYTPNTCIR